jgi:hypothetical protein
VSVVFLYEAPFFAVGIVTEYGNAGRTGGRKNDEGRKEMTLIQILQCQFEQL